MELPEVKVAGPEDTDKCVAALTLAFVADPIMRWFFPDAQDYIENFGELMLRFGGDKAFENGTARYVGDYAGAALWLPPGVEPDEERFMAWLAENFEGEKLETVGKLLGQMDEYHPKDMPLWYLAVLGLDTAHQNSGMGSLLIKNCLLEVDKAGTIAYLESSNPQNIAFYERHGFEVLGKIEVDDAPPVHPMLRQARA